ncbi:MAG: type II toxin-antitoxin system HicA family toxin [Actinobacteria bacterium]|nr:type II toxin-antitoxin system HicA family toxin [Actinomycetota bacterium]
MSKLKRISGLEAINVLKKLGFIQIRQKGSHAILKKIIDDKEIGYVVPLHSELAVGILRGILMQAKISQEEFLKHL